MTRGAGGSRHHSLRQIAESPALLARLDAALASGEVAFRDDMGSKLPVIASICRSAVSALRFRRQGAAALHALLLHPGPYVETGRVADDLGKVLSRMDGVQSVHPTVVPYMRAVAREAQCTLLAAASHASVAAFSAPATAICLWRFEQADRSWDPRVDTPVRGRRMGEDPLA